MTSTRSFSSSVRLVGFTTSLFSAGYIAHELQARKLRSRDLRFYHALYQFLMFAMDLALVSNNIGLMWVAIELATLTTVVMVGIYRTNAALEASWKYFILGSVGIGLALFGTILVYLAAQERLGEGMLAMAWDRLAAHSAGFDPALLNLSFIFLLLGYGTKVGLVPVHAWLPDAHAEGPTPISAVLSGLLLNVALFALLRFRLIMAGNPAVLSPGPMMVTMGALSLVFAGFMIYRRRDIKRMFAYSSIEHMGIITLAFGLGGPLANFAGLLHMAMHSLTKSAIFFGVGYISQLEGTQRIADIRGLTQSAAAPRMVAGRRGRRDCGAPALRDLHERVSARHLDLCPRAVARHSVGHRPHDCVQRARAAPARPGVRRDRQAPCAARLASRTHGPASGLGRNRRHLSARRRCRLVPSRGKSARVGATMLKALFGDLSAAPTHRPWPRVAADSERWRGIGEALREGKLDLLGLWGDVGCRALRPV